MSHAYHEGQPNYNPNQLYFDDCDECKTRANGAYPFEKVKDLRAAWQRAYRFETGRLEPVELPVSETEIPVLRILWSLMIELQRYGIPFGMFPGDVAQSLRDMFNEVTGHQPPHK